MSEKIHLGSAKKKGETWYKGTINMDKIEPHIQEFKGHRFIKVDINIFEEPDQYGKSLKITLDTWQPEQQDNKEQSGYPQNPLAKDDGMPF